jgi:septal ring factor EnvC (AmiA/AmiB activator)
MAAAPESKGDGFAMADDFVQVFLVKLQLHGARDVKAADGIFSKTSDPYLKAFANGKYYCTKTIMKTLDPEWNEKTQFVFFSEPKELKFELWDWDRGTKDDHIGETVLPLKGFFAEGHKGFDGELPLTLQDKKSTQKGQLRVSVTARKMLPNELEMRATMLDKKQDDLTAEIARNKAEIAGLEQDVATLETNNSTLESEIDELHHRTTGMQADNSKLADDEIQLQNDLETAQQTESDAKGARDEAKTVADASTAALTEEQKKVSGFEGEKAKLEKEIADLRAELKRKKDAASEAEKRAAEAKAKKTAADAKAKADADERESQKKLLAQTDDEDGTAGATATEASVDSTTEVAPGGDGQKCCCLVM